MSIKINIKGNTESDEYRAALMLSEIFKRDLPTNIEGEILIYANATLFGQSIKDIDIIVVGKFENYILNINSSASYKKDGRVQGDDFKNRKVQIKDFCFVIELKQHDARDFWREGPELFVKYKNRVHSVTSQSEKQKYSLKGFFEERLSVSPYIYNFVWMLNCGLSSIHQLVGEENINKNICKHNYLPRDFSLNYLFDLTCMQKLPWIPDYSDVASISSFFGKSVEAKKIDSIFQIFNEVKRSMGEMTRKKVARITQTLLKGQKYAEAIGEKLVIIQGRAGTGKTIKLLSIACDLARDRGARCLILTYNIALVGDIKRMIALADIPDKPDKYSVDIRTLDSFFYEILKGFRIGTIEKKTEDKITVEVKDFLKEKEKYLTDLYNYIEHGLDKGKEIQTLMKSSQDAINWDYVLIDEGQDWGELERKIIFKIFGFKHCIVADGVDQLIRTQKKCVWSKDLRLSQDFEQTHEKRGLRQEVNLVNFVNYFANKINVNWEIESEKDMVGGKIIVSLKPYSKEIHDIQFDRVKKSENAAYEMLFLVPPSLVVREASMDNFGKNSTKRYFKHKDVFSKQGINIWDGTSQDLRSEYVVSTDQHRLLQYESCRGLEGWCVVCLDFDEFIKYKWQTYKQEENEGQLGLDTSLEDKKRFVNLWSLIPFTRAIDTLVITINDKESPVCKVLRKIHEEHPDYVEWIE